MSWWSDIIWRTTSLTKWGMSNSGGVKLPAATVDNNFWILVSAITALQDHQTTVAAIDHFVVSGNQFSVAMTDGTVLGPYTLPQINWTFRGPWAAPINYAQFDVVTESGSVYQVNVAHASVSPFDPNATDGLGHNLYSLLLAFPSLTIAAGGVTGQVLFKQSNTDYDTVWNWADLAALHDVALTSPLTNHELLRWDTVLNSWTNWTMTLTPPTTGILGGVELTPAVTHQFLTSVNADGSLTQAQPAFTDISGVADAAQVRQPVVTTITTASPSIDPTLGDVFELTPSGNTIVVAASIPAGARITVIVKTSGTSSYNVTFNAIYFKNTGILATGVTDAKSFTVTFVSDGDLFYETSRTVAM